jgi:hypothetical protein
LSGGLKFFGSDVTWSRFYPCTLQSPDKRGYRRCSTWNRGRQAPSIRFLWAFFFREQHRSVLKKNPSR